MGTVIGIEHLNPTVTLIIIAVFVYAIARQFMAKPVRRLGFIIFPLLALCEAMASFPKTAVPAGQAAECAAMVALALAAAAIQAAFTEVFYKNDRLYLRSKPVAIVTWAAYFVIRLSMRFVFGGTEEWVTWLGMAVILGGRGIMLYIRHPEIGRALAQGGRRSR